MRLKKEAKENGARAVEERGGTRQSEDEARRRSEDEVRSPPDPTDLFSEGGEVIPFHIKGSLTIPTAGIKRV